MATDRAAERRPLSDALLFGLRKNTPSASHFLDWCDLRVTAFDDLVRYGACRSSMRVGTAMIGNVMSDGRLLSLQAGEWLILLVGGLAGSLILMF
jgi:hypothetical protein